MTSRIVPVKNHERGAVLIVALVMLLLLTIIGLASIRGTALQENMAGNMRDSNLALQAAEAALRKGEEAVEDGFNINALNNLELESMSGVYSDFPGTLQNPEYEVFLLAKLRTSTEAGVPIDDEGMIVRIESDGYGLNARGDNSAGSHTQLRSTFLIEQ